MPFLCMTCGKGFVDTSQLARHATTHGTARPWTCDTCGKRFRSRETWRQHVRGVHGASPGTCATCGKAYVSPASLRVHALLEHPSPHESETVVALRAALARATSELEHVTAQVAQARARLQATRRAIHTR